MSVPYLCGVTRENWLHVQQFVSEETIVVDLDRNNVMFGEKTPQMPPVPGKKWLKLQTSLDHLVGLQFWKARGLENEYRLFRSNKLQPRAFKRIARQKGDQRWNERLEIFDHAFYLQYTPDSENILSETPIVNEQSQWDRVQESFLRFFVAMLKDYRKFLEIPDADTPASPVPGASDWLQWSKRRSFDKAAFIASQKPEYFSYLTELCGTQQFDDFITKRLYSPELPDIIFFDQSIDAKLNRSRLKFRKVDTPFLQSAKTHKKLETFHAVEPNALDLPGSVQAPFMYKSWPETFDSAMFCTPKPMPTMITAEFDRQAALIKRLRTNHSPEAASDSYLLEFYRSDYDSCPETMAFTVFFFTYSTLIGREWADYQLKRRELQHEVEFTESIEDRDPKPEDLGPREEAKLHEPALGVEVAEIPDLWSDESARDLISDLTLGMCENCPDAHTTVANSIIYVTGETPCPRYMDELNDQSQVAKHVCDIINQISPFSDLNQQRGTSLLDDDDGLAEFEESRDVAVAQLDLAFDTLKAMEMRGLFADPDIFKSLMEACGRCGDTTRALELIEMMKRNGLVADKEVLSCFISAFAHDVRSCLDDSPFKDDLMNGSGRRSSDAYAHFLRKKLKAMGGNSTSRNTMIGNMTSDDDDFQSEYERDSSSDSGKSEAEKLNVGSSRLLDWFTPHKTSKQRSRRRRRKKSKYDSEHPVPDRLMKQILLGESLLEFLYPSLKIDTSSDCCPRCSTVMSENAIISGWKPCEFQDFTTQCPQCQHRFVPRFSVSSKSPTFKGSQGPGTPLFCEFLSPWVLRKELDHVILDGGIDVILDPEWRSGTDIRASLWWNLIALCNRYRLPVSFLLQGSFQNRLINPSPQD